MWNLARWPRETRLAFPVCALRFGEVLWGSHVRGSVIRSQGLKTDAEVIKIHTASPGWMVVPASARVQVPMSLL